MMGEQRRWLGRLEAAPTEQARLTAQHERAIGTSMELSSFSRLHTANLRVGRCQRAIDSADRPGAFAFSIAGGVEAPAEARNRVVDGLDGALDDAMRDTLRLLVSEVTTNCVQHAHAGADARIDVAVSLPPGAVRVEVSTAGAPFESPPVMPVRPRPQDRRGRGLFIVDSLARAWGVERCAANRVWFELATTVPARPHRSGNHAIAKTSAGTPKREEAHVRAATERPAGRVQRFRERLVP